MRAVSIFVFAVMMFGAMPAKAQFAAQMDAAYLATLKAVMDYKINDEEHLREVNQLREDVRFNQKLEKMLGQLDNSRTGKSYKNKQILDILEKAGKDIYRILQ